MELEFFQIQITKKVLRFLFDEFELQKKYSGFVSPNSNHEKQLQLLSPEVEFVLHVCQVCGDMVHVMQMEPFGPGCISLRRNPMKSRSTCTRAPHDTRVSRVEPMCKSVGQTSGCDNVPCTWGHIDPPSCYATCPNTHIHKCSIQPYICVF